jgi:hypothetical protein
MVHVWLFIFTPTLSPETALFELNGLLSTFKTRSNSYNFSKSVKNWLDISILGGAGYQALTGTLAVSAFLFDICFDTCFSEENVFNF